MTTAEKITLCVAIATALGVGALLKSWVDHLLARREKKVTIADKAVQIADALMTRMEAELTRAHDALAKAQKECEELRAELGLNRSISGEDSIGVINAKRKLWTASEELSAARSMIGDIRVKVHEHNALRGLGAGLGSLIPTAPALPTQGTNEASGDQREGV